jgi:hypothetical protein
MRFSDMMGSGDEGEPKPPAPSDAETVIADALAPYLDAAKPALPVDPVESEPVEPVAPLPRAPVAPIAPIAPFASGATVENARAEQSQPVAARMVDFTPLSDDLLPHRR